MVEFNITSLDSKLQEGMKALAPYIGFGVDGGVRIFYQKTEGELRVDADKRTVYVHAPTPSAFYRGIGHYVEKQESMQTSECRQFDTCGMMFDCSRNGVLTVEKTKFLLAKMAIMGMNMYMPYIEDIYPVDAEPLFGYMRGRYTKDELRAIDAFAASVGIEVVPGIQTLSHLGRFLNLRHMGYKYRDNGDTLLADSEDTYELIDSMFKTLTEVFSSRRVNVGMDETYALGTGAHLKKHGYEESSEIFCRHLDRVYEIARKYSCRIMMWDDMFYNGEKPVKVHEDVTPIYWNYYDDDKDKYIKDIDLRLKNGSQPVFAGGAWRWGAYAPKLSKTAETSNAALTACKEKGIRNVFVTSWGDDANEGPASSVLFGMVVFAEHAYNEKVDGKRFAERLPFLTGLTLDEWLLQEKVDYIGDRAPGTHCPSKIMVYSDPLVGLFDEHIARWSRHIGERSYADLAEQFRKSSETCAAYQKSTMAMFADMCTFLEYKWNLGVRLTDAYKNADRIKLGEIANELIDKTVPACESLRKSLRALWYEWYKLNGFEVLDVRIGGITARLKSTTDLIYDYLSGKTDRIEPLEEKRELLDEVYTGINSYGCIATAGNILH